MELGALGYYGFGNAGDEIILDNLRRIFEPHNVTPVPLGLTLSEDTIARLNAFDFLILGGGGLIQGEPPSPFGMFPLWERDLKTPLGGLGLGVSHLSPQFQGAVHRLIERAKFFLVRDETSKRILDHPKVQVAPDLTFYDPFPFRAAPQAIAARRPICGVNLRPSRQGIDRWISALERLPCERQGIPFSIHPALGDVEALERLSARKLTPFTPEAYQEIDVLIGTAFHSIVFAIQMGVPALAIDYDPKVNRLMHDAGLGAYLLEWEAWDQLAPAFDRLMADREHVRERMRAYRDRARDDVHSALSEPQRKIAATVGHTQRRSTTPVTAPPLISVLIPAFAADEAQIRATLDSCREGGYPNLEILALLDEGASPLVGLDDRVLFQLLEPEREDWVLTGIRNARGALLTWLTPGARLMRGALSRLAGKLADHPSAEAAIAGYHLTRANVIERKVSLHHSHDPHTARSFSPCFLVRRSQARDFYMRQKRDPSARPDPNRIAYVRSTLLYQPASDCELALFRGVLAISRGDLPRGRTWFQEAFEAQRQSRGRMEPVDLVELIARTSRNATVTDDPTEFVDLISRNLPERAAEMHTALKRARASVLMTSLFERHRLEPWSRLARTALRGVRSDPSWLRNRGMWSILARSLLHQLRLTGEPTPQKP